MKKFWPIILIGFIVYLPILKAGFIAWDDDDLLSEEKLNWQGVKNIFTDSPLSTYVPLTVLSFAVENAVFEQNSLAFHFDNLVLHLLVCYLIYVLIMMLGFECKVAWMTSLLFCIHPMHVESVAWITERKDVLYSAFYLASIILYIKYWKENRSWLYVASIACSALSILAKPMALSIPLILILVDWYLKRNLTWKLLLEKIPFFLVVIPVASITFAHNHNLLTDGYSIHSPIIWVWSLIFYLHHFLIPTYFMHSYTFPDFTNLNYETTLSLITFIVMIGGLWILRKKRILIFAYFWFAFSLFFLLRFWVPRYDIVADRFMYLPSLGLCVLIASFLCYMVDKVKIITIVLLLILIPSLFYKTYIQVKVWDSDFSFFSNVNRYNPDSFLANLRLSQVYYQRKQYAHAVYFLSRIKTDNQDQAENMLIQQRKIMNKIDGSLYRDLEKKMFIVGLIKSEYLLNCDPRDGRAMHWRGLFFENLGRQDLAILDYQKALTMNISDEAKKILLENILKLKQLKVVLK